MKTQRIQPLTPHVWMALLFFAGSFFSPQISHAVPDACDPSPHKTPTLLSTNSNTRVAAIRGCLAAVAEVLPMNQLYDGKLYTYGHPAKIKKMQDLNQNNFWDYQTRGFQRRKEENTAIGAAKTSINRASEAEGNNATMVITQAKNHYAANYDLQHLADAYALIHTPTHTNKAAYHIAALAKVFPNFITHLEHHIQHTEFPREGGKSKHQVQGEKTAGTMSGYDSTGGLGVYLAMNPYHTVHYGDHAMTVPPPAGNVFINIKNNNTKAALVRARILIHEDVNDGLILRPTGKKQLFISPQDFEKAAEGRYLIGFPDPHDALNAKTPFVCG